MKLTPIILLAGLYSIGYAQTSFGQSAGGDEKQSKLIGTQYTQNVDPASGALSLSVPLAQIPDANIPFSLTASNVGTGVRVSSRGGTLGVGWSLNTGFQVSRIILDIPDEQEHGWYEQASSLGHYPSQDIIQNYASGIENIALPTTALDGLHAAMREFSEKAFVEQYPNGPTVTRRDGSPDLYLIQLGGQSYKFIFPDEYGPAGICLDKGATVSAQRTTAGFKVIDEAGTEYLFNNAEYRNSYAKGEAYDNFSDRPAALTSPPYDPDTRIATSWQLTSAKSMLSAIDITCTYEPYDFSYVDTDDLLNIIESVVCPGGADPWSALTRNIAGFKFERTDIYIKETKLRLTKVETPIHTCILTYKSLLEAYSKDELQLLTSIKVSDKIDNRNVETQLEYLNIANARLALKRVSNLIDGGVRSWIAFTYFGGPNSGFQPTSNAYDYWGYYTGRSEYEHFAVPASLYQTGWNFTNQAILNISGLHADRTPLLSAAQRMSVETVTQSTGVVQRFEYGLNRGRDLHNPGVGLQDIGGLRIDRIFTTGTGSAFQPSRMVEYSYLDANGSPSGVMTTPYPYPFRMNKNAEYGFATCGNSEATIWATHKIHRDFPGAPFDFNGRSCIYSRVTETNQTAKMVRTFTVPDKTIMSFFKTVERNNHYLSLENVTFARQPFTFPFQSPLVGQMTQEIVQELDGTEVSRRDITYTVVSEPLTYGTSNRPYYAILTSTAGVGKGGQNSWNGTEQTSWVQKKGDRIQFALIPFKREVALPSTIQEGSKISGTSVTTTSYSADFARPTSQVTALGRKQFFKSYTYKDALAIPASTTDPLANGLRSLSPNVPIQVLQGYIDGSNRYVTSGTGVEYQQCARMYATQGLDQTRNMLLPAKQFVFKGKVDIGSITAPSLSCVTGQPCTMVFDGHFLQQSSSSVTPNGCVFTRDASGLTTAKTVVYNGTIPGVEMSNVSANSYYADNMEGFSLQVMGTETNTVWSTYNLNHVYTQGPRPGRWLTINQSDYHEPSFTIDPSRYDEGVQVLLKYMTVGSGTNTIKLRCYSGNTLVSTTPINLPAAADFIYFSQKFKPSDLGMTSPSTTYRFVVTFEAYSNALRIMNLFMGNGNARCQFTKAAPGGTTVFVQDHTAKTTRQETDHAGTYTMSFDLDGFAKSAKTLSLKNRQN